MSKKNKKPSFSSDCLDKFIIKGGKLLTPSEIAERIGPSLEIQVSQRLFPLLPPLTWDSVLKKHIEKREKEYYDRKRKD